LAIGAASRSLGDMHTYDVAVIGGGAAGLSGALVLTRARRSVLVIDAGHPRNAPAAAMHGFIGRDGTPPADLLAVARREVTSYGGTLVRGTVTDVATADDGRLLVTRDDGDVVAARRVLLTTGLHDEIVDVPGAHERWGRDVLHCPYCHGYEVRDQKLGVLGGTPASVDHALLLRQWSGDVVYFANGAAIEDADRERMVARAIGVVEEPLRRLVVRDDRLAGVELADGRVVARSAVFVRPRLIPHHDLLTGLGCTLDDDGWPVVDPTGRTSVPGVWAAGNAADPRAQVVTAAGQGSAAAIAINADLVEEDTARDVLAHRAGLPA
jgi:thioredoxin reductase